jgi:hypothetical protein
MRNALVLHNACPRDMKSTIHINAEVNAHSCASTTIQRRKKTQIETQQTHPVDRTHTKLNEIKQTRQLILEINAHCDLYNVMTVKTQSIDFYTELNFDTQ